MERQGLESGRIYVEDEGSYLSCYFLGWVVKAYILYNLHSHVVPTTEKYYEFWSLEIVFDLR